MCLQPGDAAKCQSCKQWTANPLGEQMVDRPLRICLGAIFATILLSLVASAESSAQTQSSWLPLRIFQPYLFDWVDVYLRDQQQSDDDDVRLATLPDMFGDSIIRGGALTLTSLTPELQTTTDVALAGGSRGLKIAEHNKAIPADRIYFNYQHFHNVLDANLESPIGTPVASNNFSVDRYTLGLEKRFGQGLWSVELRMPFTGGYDFNGPLGLVQHSAGEVGNLSAIIKRLIYYDACTSVCVGLGVETPTGSDFRSDIFGPVSTVSYQVSNDAVHLHPYIGVLRSPSDDFFFHGFAQLDLSLNGNRVSFVDAIATDFGRYTDQTLLYIDVGGGCWLYRNPCAPMLTGVASLVEFHYTTAVSDSDNIVGASGLQSFTQTQTSGSVDVVNISAALHVELARDLGVRAGVVAPITNNDDRLFDSEIGAQLLYRF